MLDVQIIYEKDCPNYARSCQILCDVIASHQLEIAINIREAQPSDSSFYGSPTMLINGIDVEKCYKGELQSDDESIFSACRVYECDHHIGCPSEEMIECTLTELGFL